MALADQLAVSILGDIGNLSAGMDKAASKVGAFGKKVEAVGKRMSSVGKKMSMAITLPLVAFGAMAVKFGSDAEEIQSKFNAVFKQTAGVVTDWIDEFAGQVGRSKTALKDYAATFQDTFVPLGFVREEAAKLSTRLVELTIDLASFNNASEPETMRALQSAIVGNHETVRRFGVIINQAGLNIELMNMGIKEGAKTATEAEKAQARLNLIIRGTTDAQGDAIRTSGSFANVVKALKADFRDLFEEISKHIIPVLTKIIEKVRGVIGYFKDLDFDTQRLIMGFALVAAAMGPVLLVIGKVITILPKLSLALNFLAAHPVFIALAALVIAITLIVTHLEELKDIWDATWEYIKLGTEKFINGIITAINWLIDGINLLINTINLIPGISIPGLGAIGYVDFSAAIGDASRTVAGALNEGLGGIAGELEGGFSAVVPPLENITTTLDTELTDLSTNVATAIEASATTMSEAIGLLAEPIIAGIERTLSPAMEKLTNLLKDLPERAKDIEDLKNKLAGIDATIAELLKETEQYQPYFDQFLQADADADFAAQQIQKFLDVKIPDVLREQLAAQLVEAMQRREDAKAQLDELGLSLTVAQEAADALITANLLRETTNITLDDLRAKFKESTLVLDKILVPIHEMSISIGDGLLKVETGIIETKEGFVQQLKTLEVNLGSFLGVAAENVALSFHDGIADLKLKIGDSVVSIRSIIQVATLAIQSGIFASSLNLITGIAVMLGPLALIGVGIFLILVFLEKFQDFIKAFLTMIFLPFIIIGKFLQGIIKFFTGKSAEAGAAVVPVMQAGGIVPGLPGVPVPMIGHGGEPFGAAGMAQILNYEMIGRAVAAGVYDAMMEVLSKDRGRPFIVNIDGKKAAQALFQPFLLEQERRGGEALFS